VVVKKEVCFYRKNIKSATKKYFEVVEMKLAEEIKKEIISNILKVVKARKIVLFGSYANGMANEESDIDILIIEKEVDSKIQEKRKIRKSLKNIKCSKDILVTSEEEYNVYSLKYGSIYKEIDEKGEVLWSF